MRSITFAAAWLVVACNGGETDTAGVGGSPMGPSCGHDEAFVDGTCKPVGVSIDGCGEGFEQADGGCSAILPLGPCGAGEVAFPGEESCHELAPCTGGKWGNAPTVAKTVYVDASFQGAADGSMGAPFPTIGEAIAVAAPGSAVAIATGTYAEDVWPDQALHFYGACVQSVVISGGTVPSAVFLSVDASSIRDVTIESSRDGLAISGTDIVVENVRIKDSGEIGGVILIDALGPASASFRNVLVESCQATGMFIAGSELYAERLAVRDIDLDPMGLKGVAIGMLPSPTTATPPSVTIQGSIVERAFSAGLTQEGGRLEIVDSLIRDVAPVEMHDGEGIITTRAASGATAELVLYGVVIERVHTSGVVVAGAMATAIDTTIRETLQADPLAAHGAGVTVQASGGVGSELTMSNSLVEDTVTAGVLVLGSRAFLDAMLVRTITGGPDDLFGDGIVVAALGGGANAEVRTSRVTSSVRAGVSAFGATLLLDSDTLSCNGLHIASESLMSVDATIVDEGGNLCGCGDVLEPTCKATSAGLLPPSPPL